MDVKHRGKAEKMNSAYVGVKNRKSKPYKKCPFCGGSVFCQTSNRGITFFTCPDCLAKISFADANTNESIELWNERVQ